jgi:hypothetical protein
MNRGARDGEHRPEREFFREAALGRIFSLFRSISCSMISIRV